MEKQEVKIKYDKGECFFFAHSFVTALGHANNFIERNKGKIEMKLYTLNESSFGERWIFQKTVKKE